VRQAAYASKTVNSTAYAYTVQATDEDSDGIQVVAVTLNGDTIRDAVGNNADLALSGHVRVGRFADRQCSSAGRCQRFAADRHSAAGGRILERGEPFSRADAELCVELWRRHNRRRTNPTHTFGVAGTYTVTLTVSDEFGVRPRVR